MAEHPPAPAPQTAVAPQTALAHQFDDLEQQYEASHLGMWAFLLTEVMFFGGLFAGYTVYRTSYLAGFIEGSQHLDVLLGTVNTVVLISSSLTMALAVHAAQAGRRQLLVRCLLLTLLLGLVFLGIKGYEYWHKYDENLVPGVRFSYAGAHADQGGAHADQGGAHADQVGAHADQVQLFLLLYFVLTGLHALHMVIGLGLLAILIVLAWRARFSSLYHTPVEMIGLYWHFVDVVWIFLYPLLYLIG